MLAGSFWVAQVVDETGGVVSTELVLTGDRFCYSFLGGTRASAYPASPNDLLKHRVIEHGAEVGLAGYVLGGGYQPGDGIFRYKRSFDPTGIVPFMGVRLVADQAAYELMSGPAIDADFFPAYRAASRAD